MGQDVSRTEITNAPLRNRWTKWSVQLKRLNDESAGSLLIEFPQLLYGHGTIQTHFFTS